MVPRLRFCFVVEKARPGYLKWIWFRNKAGDFEYSPVNRIAIAPYSN